MPGRRYASQGLFSARIAIQSCQKGGGQAGNTDHPAKRRRTKRLDKFLTKRYKGMPLPLVYKYIRKGARQAQRKRAKRKLSADRGRRAHALHPSRNSRRLPRKGRADQRVPAHPAVGQRRIRGRKTRSSPTKTRGCWCIPTRREARTRSSTTSRPTSTARANTTRAPSMFAPALCNRIDRNTCGLVIAAKKRGGALREMNEIIREARREKKLYLAAAKGRFAEKSGRLRLLSRKIGGRKPRRGQDKKNGAGDKKPCRSTPFSDTTKSWTFPCWKSSLSPGGRTRSARSLPPQGIPCSGTEIRGQPRRPPARVRPSGAVRLHAGVRFRRPHELLGYLKGEFDAARPPTF